MSEPLVSIVVPTYNRPDEVYGCLQSIYDQTYPNIEVVVHDDGGDVENCERIMRYTHGWSSDGGRRLFVSRDIHNQGVETATNTGMLLATGEYIGILADDDRLRPNHVELLVEALRTQGRAIAQTQAVIRYRRQREDDAAAWYDWALNTTTFSHPCTRDACWLGGNTPLSCLLAPRELWRELGPFDPELAFSDNDMLCRIGKLTDITFVPQVTVEIVQRVFGQHHGHRQASGFDGVRNLFAFFAKHPTIDQRIIAQRKNMVLVVLARDPSAPWIFEPTHLLAAEQPA